MFLSRSSAGNEAADCSSVGEGPWSAGITSHGCAGSAGSAGSHSLSCSAARCAGSSSGTPLGGGERSMDPAGAASRSSHRPPCPLPGVGRLRPSLCFDDGLAASPRPRFLPWLLLPSPLLAASPRPRPLPWPLPPSPLLAASPRPRPLPWLPLPPSPLAASPRPAPLPRREPLEPLLGAAATEPASGEEGTATGIVLEFSKFHAWGGNDGALCAPVELLTDSVPYGLTSVTRRSLSPRGGA